ncbi:MAG: transglycosylase SLT domain-containing protein [Holophagales bacterium]|jgi:hypothetical protein|nr:transglycosylase SLT domain-containing protein [Holophagales bacterium]
MSHLFTELPLGKLFRLLLATIAILSAASLAKGQQAQYFYTYIDHNGKKMINNMPPNYMRGKGYTLVDVTTGPSIRLAITQRQMSLVLRSPEMIALIDKISAEHGVDTWLVRAVIQAESAFYEKARSKAGALGLMQLIPATAARFGVVDPFDPVQNITGGVKYLRWLMDYFGNDFTKVIAAYNAGENAVNRHNGIPPFAETRAYVPKVMNLWKNKSVVEDPAAKGAIDYLNKGKGGFTVAANSSAAKPAAEPAPTAARKPLYRWEDEKGRPSITDSPPPKGAKNVKVY